MSRCIDEFGYETVRRCKGVATRSGVGRNVLPNITVEFQSKCCTITRQPTRSESDISDIGRITQSPTVWDRQTNDRDPLFQQCPI